jgi:hypothetical protein
MGSRLLPRDLHELYAHALALEHAAATRFVELERYTRDAGMDRTGWEYAAHFLGPQADAERAPRNVRDALVLALAIERRTQNFYVDVAEHAADDAMCAFAGEMAVDEGRHIARLERLLAREPDPGAARPGEGDVLPLKP